LINYISFLLAEKDEADAPEPEPKKERRKSTGRAAPTRTSNARSKATPSRTSAKSKKLAMFSSDEEATEDEVTVKSMQTSPIGFPSPEVSLRDISAVPTNSFTKKQTAASSPLTKRRLSSRVDAISRKPTGMTSNKPDLITQAYQPSRKIYEFSDDDFDESHKSTYSSLIYSTMNGLHHRPIDQSRKDADDLLFKKPTSVPSSTTPTTHHFSSSPSPSRILSPLVRRNSPLLDNKISFKEDELRSKIDDSLHQMRRSFSSKKPSPIKNTQTNLNTKHNNADKEESESDEELDADIAYSSRNDLWQIFVKNKNNLLILLFSLLFITAAIFTFLYNSDDTEGLLEGGQPNGKCKHFNYFTVF